MSLYKARDWWTTTCGNDEEFEARSVVIGTIEDNLSKSDIARSPLLMRSDCVAEFTGFGSEGCGENREVKLNICRVCRHHSNWQFARHSSHLSTAPARL